MRCSRCILPLHMSHTHSQISLASNESWFEEDPLDTASPATTASTKERRGEERGGEERRGEERGGEERRGEERGGEGRTASTKVEPSLPYTLSSLDYALVCFWQGAWVARTASQVSTVAPTTWSKNWKGTAFPTAPCFRFFPTEAVVIETNRSFHMVE